MCGTEDCSSCCTKQLIITANSQTPSYTGPVPQQGKTWGGLQIITITSMFSDTNETEATLSYTMTFTSGNPQEAPLGGWTDIEDNALAFSEKDTLLYNQQSEGNYIPDQGFLKGIVRIYGGTGCFESATGYGIVKPNPTLEHPNQLTATFFINVLCVNYETAKLLLFNIPT